jgi:hypothetical protein
VKLLLRPSLFPGHSRDACVSATSHIEDRCLVKGVLFARRLHVRDGFDDLKIPFGTTRILDANNRRWVRNKLEGETRRLRHGRILA